MRVLIATVTAGGGHLAAAAALDEAWKSCRPDDVVQKIDLLDFCSRLHRKIYSDGYVKLVERAPEIWGLMFKTTDNPKAARRLNRIKNVLPGNSRLRVTRHVRHFNPDIVLCTHYLPLEMLGRLRNKTGLAKPMTVSVVTDFEAHAFWMDPCVDVYCVAAEETRVRLIARGAPAESVIATGIPIAARFASQPDPKTVRKAKGLRDDLPVLLVLSGGFGMGPVAEILSALDRVARPFQTVVVAGRNEDLRRELAAADRKHPTHVLGLLRTCTSGWR